ncbi:hypothetical protein G7046_g2983 [Stylonectria norvegica]|nr:hypothetical protein G7046_g2983 [Stylonectria norvegica]
MSGLEALGLACNIFQVISFAHETISICKRVYQDGSPCPDLTINATHLDSMAAQVQALGPTGKLAKDEQQLLDVAKACQRIAADLNDEITIIVGQSNKGNVAATLKTAVKMKWRRRRLEAMEKKLADAQRLMETSLNIRICNKVDMASIELGSVNRDLRSFIQQYNQGQRTTSGLILKEVRDATNDVTAHVTRTEVSINQHITATSDASFSRVSGKMRQLKLEVESSTEHTRLLNSFKFPAMNERRNQVAENYESTFRWIHEENPSSSKSWDSFPKWLNSNDPIYWISGKAGSGKTTLTKYLLNHQSTRSLLELWKPDVIVISHFLWRPGNAMQRNIKGFLCSVIYQLLQHHAEAAEYVRQTYDKNSTKDSDTDWSLAELRRVTREVAIRLRSPICLFVDGLDEVDTQDELAALFDVLDELKRLPNMKMCLSSRREQVIVDQLGDRPQLQIHDLTRDDLREFAVGSIRFPSSFATEDNVKSRSLIIDHLVEKAEGVFLWLSLVVDSTNRGLRNGDDFSLLLDRVEHLPGDLVDLYKDMWARLNDDQGIYAQKAAIYFKLAMLSRQFFSEHFGPMVPTSFMAGGISVLEMKFASVPPPDSFFSLDQNQVPVETLVRQCENTEKSLGVCCAGFLEVTDSSVVKFEPLVYGTWGRLTPYILGERTIRFLHRTAFDFINDTSEGQEILGFDSTPFEMLQLRILKACLAVRYIFALAGRWWLRIPPWHSLSNRSYCSSIDALLDDLSYIHETVECNQDAKKEFQRLIELSEPLYKSYPQIRSWRRHCTGQFLVRAASYNLGDFVPRALSTRKISSIMKAEILRSVAWPEYYIRTPCMFKLLWQMLSPGSGCSPSWRGAVHPREGLPYVSPYLIENALGIFLRSTVAILAPDFTDHYIPVDTLRQYVTEIPDIISAFVAGGASLEDTVIHAFLINTEGILWPKGLFQLFQQKVQRDCFCASFKVSFLVEVILNKLDQWQHDILKDPFTTSSASKVKQLKPQKMNGAEALPIEIIGLLNPRCNLGSYLKLSDEDGKYLANAVGKRMLNDTDESTAMELRARYLEVKTRGVPTHGPKDALVQRGFMVETDDPERILEESMERERGEPL